MERGGIFREIDSDSVRDTIAMVAAFLEERHLVIREKEEGIFEQLAPVFSLTTVALREVAYDLRDWIEALPSEVPGGEAPMR